MTAAALSTFGPYARVEVMARRGGLPETRPGVSPAAVSIFLGRIGEEGRALYMLAVTLDFALPLLLALAGWTLVSWARSSMSPPSVFASLTSRLTILAVAAEIFENALLLIAAARYPGRPLLGNLIGVLVTTKFALIALTALTGLLLTIAVVRDRLRRRPADRARAA
jgi:hypothetical protein